MFYGATNDYEWYSPEAVNTTGGALTITLTQKDTHNLNFQSGMVQSWNKLCFQGGYLEFSLQFPAFPYTQGYWPAAWIMGNLARPGYLGSTDGMWPYSYSSCDTGILPNQTFINQTGPYQALHSRGQWAKHGQLSYLDGMRSPSCTCPGEDHPGPNNTVGRSAPEIDVLEAQVRTTVISRSCKIPSSLVRQYGSMCQALLTYMTDGFFLYLSLSLLFSPFVSDPSGPTRQTRPRSVPYLCVRKSSNGAL